MPLALPRPARAPTNDAYADVEASWTPAGYAALADRPAVLVLVLLAWSGAGLAVAAVLARRGYEAGPWAALGVVFGPFLVGLAVEAVRRGDEDAAPIEVAPGRPGPGDLTVVVALLTAPERAADAAPVLRWLAPELGEVVVAGPVAVEAAVLDDRDDALAAGTRRLSQAALFLPTVEPRLVLVPGGGADAVARFADEAGAAVLVVVGDDRARAVRACARRLRGRTIVAAPRRSERERDT